MPECPICKKEFRTSIAKRKNCSTKCAKKAQEKFEIEKDVLQILVWEKPTRQIAKDFGVSDNAIGKRCKKLNIPKPPRGYWAKLQKM